MIYTPTAAPRMSPTPRSAKYGATHSCNPSRGSENVRLRSSSPHRAHHRIALPRAATLAASPCATTRHAAPRCTAPPRSAARTTLRRSRHAAPLAPRHAVPHLRATSPCATACRIAPLGGNSLRRRRSCIAMLSDLSDWSDSSDGPWCYQQARLWLRGGAMMCVASTEGCAVVR